MSEDINPQEALVVAEVALDAGDLERAEDATTEALSRIRKRKQAATDGGESR